MEKNILFISKDQVLFQELLNTVQKQGYAADFFSYDDINSSSIDWTHYALLLTIHPLMW